ncbi:MAG: ABC transporter permease subunit [Acidilobus sp.]
MQVIEAAKVDGASEWTIFRRFVLSLGLPGILSAFIYSFIMIWNDFFIPLVAIANAPRYLVLPLAAMDYESYGIAYSDAFAAGVISVFVLLIIFAFLGRYFVRGLASLGGAAKGL